MNVRKIALLGYFCVSPILFKTPLMNTAKRKAIFEVLAKEMPAPTTELIYQNPFELLIAVMLSAQATDKSVNRATPALFAKAPDPKSMLALGEAALAEALKTLNFYRTKARHILATCEILIAQHQGAVPHTQEALEALPGVGRKTANVVLNTAFGEPTIAVDTHIFRLANRAGLAKGKTPRQVEDILLKTTPKAFKKDAHHWLILHGRYVCKARKPSCAICKISSLCEYPDKTP